MELGSTIGSPGMPLEPQDPIRSARLAGLPDESTKLPGPLIRITEPGADLHSRKQFLISVPLSQLGTSMHAAWPLCSFYPKRPEHLGHCGYNAWKLECSAIPNRLR